MRSRNALDDFGKFVDRSRRIDQSESAIFGSIGKLSPPAFDEGTD